MLDLVGINSLCRWTFCKFHKDILLLFFVTRSVCHPHLQNESVVIVIIDVAQTGLIVQGVKRSALCGVPENITVGFQWEVMQDSGPSTGRSRI